MRRGGKKTAHPYSSTWADQGIAPTFRAVADWHNKGYTREHGGVEGGGGGMRATGRGVSKTPTNTTLVPLYYTVVQQYAT